MFSRFNIVALLGGMMIFMPSLTMSAQEKDREYPPKPDRETVLLEDISRLSERAVRDNVISEDERENISIFVRDSLPGGKELKLRALKQIRDELDEQYAEMVRNSQQMFDDFGYIGSRMLPGLLEIPDDYVSPEERQKAQMMLAKANGGIDKKELMKYVKPLPMKPWLMYTLRFLFGAGVNMRPERWDYTVVPQMGGLYHIIMPGGRPDDSWRDRPKMTYDPHPDRHFRR